MICFSLASLLIRPIISKSGPFLLAYLSTGIVFAAIIFNIWEFYSNYKKTGNFWQPQNIIIDGKVNWKNLIGFLIFSITL
jgi:hypothetical protein